MKRVTEPIIELLAIKLYEHDHQDGQWPPKDGYRITNWAKINDEDRQLYRDMASGKRSLYGV